MKNKSAVLFVLGLMLGMAGLVHAANARSGAKGTTSVFGSTSFVSVSTGPAVLWAVTLGTGAVTDFVTLFDSASVLGLSIAVQNTNGYKIRLYPTSATANTNIVFDPPLQFNNGLVINNATALGTTLITYQRGKVSE